MRRIRNSLPLVAGILIMLYMIAPLFVIALFSFNDPPGKFNYEWSGFTTEYWTTAFDLPQLNEALITSIQLALFSSIGATLLGTLLALALVRYEFRGRTGANLLVVIPLATPEIVIGASLLSMFLLYGIGLGFTTLLIAHIMFSISFAVVIVRSRLIGFDQSFEEAAEDLGARPVVTFFKVTLPLIMPGVGGALMLSFALSLDDFVISNFNSGPVTETLPLYIFGIALRGVPVQVNVISTMLLVLTVLAMTFVILQQRRAEKMVEKRADDDKKASVAIPI